MEIRLAPFNFRIYHTKGTDNVVADSLSQMFEGREVSEQEGGFLATMQRLPLVYASLEEQQKEEPLCKGMLEALMKGDPAAAKFRLHNSLLYYQPKDAKNKQCVAPTILRLMLKYFHDSPMSRHLGIFNTWNKIGRKFYWPKMKEDIFRYVRQCDLCQRAKPAQNTKVGLHQATPTSYPLERVFIDFMEPLVRTKKRNQAIFVVVDSFSKFVAFYAVRNITSAIVCEILENRYFTAYGVPKSIVSDIAKVFMSKALLDFCFQLGIKRIKSTPYYPHSSVAERVNRNLKAALKVFHQSQQKWDQDLHLLAFAFNTALHEGAKFCPAKLFLGRELATPLESVWDLT